MRISGSTTGTKPAIEIDVTNKHIQTKECMLCFTHLHPVLCVHSERVPMRSLELQACWDTTQ